MLKLNPTTKQRLQRFYSIKRGFISFVILIVITLFAFCAEFFINNKAIVVKYNNEYYFPIFHESPYPGTQFGEDYASETDYRELQKKWENEKATNWILMPIIPYGKTEIDEIDKAELKIKVNIINEEYLGKILEINKLGIEEGDSKKRELERQRNIEMSNTYKEMFHPLPPNIKTKHYLGTDPIGRDIVAQLVYGYRVAIIFSLILLFFSYSIGITIGCLMGYFGGWTDLLGQRLIEILSRVPFLYIMMIVASIWKRDFWILLGLMTIFGWMTITFQLRTATYKEKARDYVMAARSLGAGNTRIILRHIIPSTVALIVTFIPFAVSGGIITLTSLDFLGFGLPPGQPSWGDLMKLGTSNMDAPWIVTSVVIAMVLVLFLVNMVGESIREAFDPKKFTRYE